MWITNRVIHQLCGGMQKMRTIGEGKIRLLMVRKIEDGIKISVGKRKEQRTKKKRKEKDGCLVLTAKRVVKHLGEGISWSLSPPWVILVAHISSYGSSTPFILSQYACVIFERGEQEVKKALKSGRLLCFHLFTSNAVTWIDRTEK